LHVIFWQPKFNVVVFNPKLAKSVTVDFQPKTVFETALKVAHTVLI